jgi:hypothetical protein
MIESPECLPQTYELSNCSERTTVQRNRDDILEEDCWSKGQAEKMSASLRPHYSYA